jgi:hypothetical protein
MPRARNFYKTRRELRPPCWPTSGCNDRQINGQRQMANDKWPTTNGQRQMANDKWPTRRRAQDRRTEALADEKWNALKVRLSSVLGFRVRGHASRFQVGLGPPRPLLTLLTSFNNARRGKNQIPRTKCSASVTRRASRDRECATGILGCVTRPDDDPCLFSPGLAFYPRLAGHFFLLTRVSRTERH